MLNGIHHITSLASDPQRNVDFYVDVLGLRLVKRTVNFDAPDVYHLYYGDESGHPGTVLTFFPFPDAARGKRGTREISAVAFTVPERAMDFWINRISQRGLRFEGPETRFDEQVMAFEDPDGMRVELVFAEAPSGHRHWPSSSVPKEFGIERFHGATITLARRGETDRLLREVLGFQSIGQSGQRFRYSIGEGPAKATIDIVENPALPAARQSAGSVHHIAWRVADDASQQAWKQKLADDGVYTTAVLDRNYFRSIYFREPGGVLFEIATDTPGFTVDEPLDELGLHLKLPAWLEQERRKLERILPPIELKIRETVL
ncbi:MAG TPA: ring-cleaving dioxygenase [Bacteroidota bacterium]|nr:ring-cleaving dioxygenase [Bacteroidota bacterium]